MRYPSRKRLSRNLLLIGVLIGAAVLLTACDVNFYQLGKVTGEVARQIADWLKAFFKGFASGFGGPFCTAPASLMIIGLGIVWHARRTS